jgi:aminoglycoside phosphotransferase (APT) family kinase protein
MSRSQNFRVRGPQGSVVVKSGARPAETRFYRTVMPLLKEYGIAIPEPKWLARDDEGVWWLVLEDIPQPLPRERWVADREVLAMLKRLHAVPAFRIPVSSEGLFRPRWTREMDEAALSYFGAEPTMDLAASLGEMREAYRHIFLPQCPISGDPNPTNCGLRANGSVVLYDWERFGMGTPALDLAITIPGLGDEDTFRRVASAYVRAGDETDGEAIAERVDSLPLTVGALATEIAAAKVWSVVEFLGMGAGDEISATPTIHALVGEFPRWVRGLLSR